MKKILILTGIFILCLAFSKGILKVEKSKIMYMNMNGNSIEDVEKVLKRNINRNSCDDFLRLVKDYNETVDDKNLLGDFKEFIEPSYDVMSLSEAWKSKKEDELGTNCRINSYMLLKDNLNIELKDYDKSLLLIDNEAIKSADLFDEENLVKFNKLFSKVKTENTLDNKIHAKNMEEHLKKVSFNTDAKLISVVMHDNLDGDFLFIGHCGVLVEDKNKLLFIEKLSFDEPYQAIRFNDKEELFAYLDKKYKSFTDETTSAPFIMENEKAVYFMKK